MSSNHNSIALDAWSRTEGSVLPLGAAWLASEQAYNFSIYSKNATAVSLLLYQEPDFTVPAKVYRFSFPTNKTSRVWHMFVPASEIGEARYYACELDGPFDPVTGDRFDHSKILLDPYARRIFLPPDFSRSAARGPGPNDGKAPLGILPDRTFEAVAAQRGVLRHTHDLVIYELHIRNFTKHSSCKLTDGTRGTFAGISAMILYLKDLGVTAVELMPINQYDPQASTPNCRTSHRSRHYRNSRYGYIKTWPNLADELGKKIATGSSVSNRSMSVRR
jgi:isoamylase